jgi:putative ABC transport system permease protein
VLLAHLRYGLRTFAKQPFFLAAAVLTLAVGIGATTALFSVVDAVLLKPLPYGEPEKLVSVFETRDRGVTLDGPGPANVLDWRRTTETLSGIAAWWVESTTFLDDGVGPTEEVPSAYVTVDFFSVLAVPPLLGRTFTASEVALDEPLAVLSYELWQRRYAALPSAIGRDVRFKDGTYRIIVVMPRGFRPPGTFPGEVLLFKPWDFERGYANLPEVPRDHRFLRAAARLAEDASLEEASAELDLIAEDLARAYPDKNHGWGVALVPMREALGKDARAALLVLLGAVLFVLLLTCANVASLLLVRASGRNREMAVRVALGASRFRLARQLLVESVVLSSLGGSLGVVLSWAMTAGLLRFAPEGIPRLDEVGIDTRVLLFALGVSGLAGLIAGLAPAFQSATIGPSEALRASAGAVSADRSRQRVRSTIVIAEVAAAVLLLVGASLFLRSFSRVLEMDPGFDPENLLVARMRLDGAAYGRGKAHPYYTELLERLRALPGVESAGGTTALEMDELDVDFERPFWKDGEARPDGGGPGAQIRMTTLGYFETMRIPLVAGRTFDERDGPTKPRVLLVNEAMARRTWPGESALHGRIRIDYQAYDAAYEVVGVVGDTRFYGLKQEPKPAVYIPHAQNPYLPLNIVLRTHSHPSELAPLVRDAVLQLDGSQPVHSTHTMQALFASSVGQDRFAAFLMSLFAAMAMLLAVIGLYGVVAYGVSQRQRELGLRVALGAESGEIVALVLRGGLAIAGVGIALGLAGALGMSQLLSRVLFHVSATDPATLAEAALLAAVTVVLACYVPARRAGRLDPTASLRSD